MERKTKIHAEEGKQEFVVTREFELPVGLLFRAYADPEILSQWMGTRVLKLENKPHGAYRFETSNANGNVVFAANGTIHGFTPDRRIVRTFEMENSPFEVQLEFLEFEALGDDRSKLTMHVVFRSTALRDQMLRLPFAQGINMAHNRLQEVLNPFK